MADMNLQDLSDLNNPLEWIEEIARQNNWPLEKQSDTEMSFDCEGRWGIFTLSFSWQEEFQAMQFCCASTLNVPDLHMKQIKDLMFKVNHKMWLGHFDVNDTDHAIIFRHTSLMRGLTYAGQDHIEDLIDIALTEFDRFYPAFKMQVTEREVANDMINTALFETVGEA